MASKTKLRIVLCGSTSAAKEIIQTAQQIERLGIEAVTPTNIDPTGRPSGKNKMDSFLDYFEEIKRSDAVLIVNQRKGNVEGYIGPHTMIEMAYAEALNRHIFLLAPAPQDLLWSDEIGAMKTTILNHDLIAIPKHLANTCDSAALNNTQMVSEMANEFKLERLKFILEQIDGLNKAIVGQWKQFQAVVSAIIGATAVVVATWKSYRVDPDAAKFAVQVLIWLLVFYGFFTTMTIIANVRSWFDLRIEEVECFEDALGQNYRKPPTWKNMARWSETWAIGFTVFITLSLAFIAQFFILPIIKPT